MPTRSVFNGVAQVFLSVSATLKLPSRGKHRGWPHQSDVFQLDRIIEVVEEALSLEWRAAGALSWMWKPGFRQRTEAWGFLPGSRCQKSWWRSSARTGQVSFRPNWRLAWFNLASVFSDTTWRGSKQACRRTTAAAGTILIRVACGQVLLT